MMHTFSAKYIFENAPNDVLASLLEKILKKLVTASGEAAFVREVQIFGPEAGDIIGWFRPLELEIADIESNPIFRDRIKTSMSNIAEQH